MAEDKFRLPGSSYEELTKIIKAYGQTTAPASPGEVAKLIGVHQTIVSRNNGFLLAVGIVEGGNKKGVTATGDGLARALDHDVAEEVSRYWRQIVESTDFLARLVTAVRIRRGMEEDSLQAHVAYTAGQPNKGTVKTGSATVVEILKLSGLLKDQDGWPADGPRHGRLCDELPDDARLPGRPRRDGLPAGRQGSAFRLLRGAVRRLRPLVLLRPRLHLAKPTLCPDRGGSLDGQQVPPIYDRRSFVQSLPETVTWRWYSSDPGSLRLVDGKYRFGYQDYFAFAEKPTMVQPRTFYADAMKEDLPNVAWIDPNFVDLGGLQGANDDHPPTDVMSGQSFVMRIYQALHESALWERSMLVIVYDEHGGFYDHVDPTVGFPESFTGRSEFRHFGPRVPAIVVSPFVEAGAAFGSEQDDDPSLLFDHTALIKTILLRFADDDCSDLPDRVGTSSHLGYVLTGDEARAGPEIPRDRIGQMTDWWARHIGFHLRHPHATVPALQELGVVQGPGGLEEGVIVAEGLVAKFVEWIRSGFGLKRKREAGRPEPSEVSPSVLTDTTELQLGIAAAAREIRAGGKLPPGRP